jgi:hypothetical protein
MDAGVRVAGELATASAVQPDPASGWRNRPDADSVGHGNEHSKESAMSFGGKVVTGSVLAVIGLITLKVLAALFFGFMALMGFLLFKVLPIVLVIWLGMKVIKYLTADKPAYE